MARKCALCGKKYNQAVRRIKLRGKYNPTTKRKQYPNLQWATLPSGKRVKVCTKCLKKLSQS